MLDCLERGNRVFHPSAYWRALNEQNIRQLDEQGIGNIKRTLAQNYFTWVIGWAHEQFRFLVRHTRLGDWPRILRNLRWQSDGSGLSRIKWAQLQIFTLMLWAFAKRRDHAAALEQRVEPTVGNPFPITLDGRLISQDLANASLEVNAILEKFSPPRDAPFRVCEIGAGYGRDAYLFLSMFPRSSYVIVDIPPALFVSQAYLKTLFPDRRFFLFTPADDITPLVPDILASDCVFLLPHQATQLPRGVVDLAVNISSLQEMTLPQIHAYIDLIDNLTAGFFYTKQWVVSRNPHDGIVVHHDDYPIPSRWRPLFDRTAPVQTSFFEAMYEIPPRVSQA
jgi:putative sugar O-methyltransferase